MFFVLKGTIKSISDKGNVRGWEFLDIHLSDGRNLFRIVFWNDKTNIPMQFSVEDEVTVACELKSEQKINNSTNSTYIAMRIQGWAMEKSFQGVYVADRIKEITENKTANNPEINRLIGSNPQTEDPYKDTPL